MRINYGYRDCANIININYKDRDDFDKNKGKHILTAYKDVGNFVTYNDLLEGASLYEGDTSYKYVYKIYQDIDNYHNFTLDDSKLIDNLVQRQNSIFLTEFPIGIVTIGDIQVGQVIPYYKDYMTINSVFNLMKGNNNYRYYLEIFKIFLELYNNLIYYTDIHFYNILVNRDLSDTRLIDFDSNYIGIDDEIKREEMIIALQRMYYYMNLYLGIEDEAKELDYTDDIYEMEKLVKDNYKLLLRRKEKRNGILYDVRR